MTATVVDSAAAEVVCAPASTDAIDEGAATALAATLKALADPLRLRMLSVIASDSRGETCVCDLMELSELSQPTVSHHLKVLRDVGVVSAQRRGTWVWYRLTPEGRPAITMLLDSFAPLASVLPTHRSGDTA